MCKDRECPFALPLQQCLRERAIMYVIYYVAYRVCIVRWIILVIDIIQHHPLCSYVPCCAFQMTFTVLIAICLRLHVPVSQCHFSDVATTAGVDVAMRFRTICTSKC
jgi:hypothetical protein